MRSMTGYGAASGQAGSCRLSVEVRSVNQRFLDLKINAPREYAPWEADIRRTVASVIDRGRVEVHVSRTLPPRSASVSLQKDVAAGYVKAWKQLQREFHLAGQLDLSLFANRSDLFTSADGSGDPAAEMKELEKLLGKALAAHKKEREREGANLKKDIQGRLKALFAVTKDLEKIAPTVVPKLRARLEKRLSELLGAATLEPARVVQEVALLADRSDVHEELVRLQSHLKSLESLLRSTEPVAKRIDFVLQEVNRELNTIGSKASDLSITNLVVSGKAEVEKLREQIQNVE
ncbi:MAG TPA: YicC/YloC family endoribonuclease [Candidatus Limnocylindrales bacterium]|nr:YicC/YloC family endoribonuclease [Candidatus Limnocylindrales bacterium]